MVLWLVQVLAAWPYSTSPNLRVAHKFSVFITRYEHIAFRQVPQFVGILVCCWTRTWILEQYFCFTNDWVMAYIWTLFCIFLSGCHQAATYKDSVFPRSHIIFIPVSTLRICRPQHPVGISDWRKGSPLFVDSPKCSGTFCRTFEISLLFFNLRIQCCCTVGLLRLLCLSSVCLLLIALWGVACV